MSSGIVIDGGDERGDRLVDPASVRTVAGDDGVVRPGRFDPSGRTSVGNGPVGNGTEYEVGLTMVTADPPLNMDGVQYSQIAFRGPFETSAPIAQEWRLYVVRSDGLEFQSCDPSAVCGLVKRGTVIGMSGAFAHIFRTADCGLQRRVETAWCETLLGLSVTNDQAVIAMGRIPQSSLPFLSLLGGFIRIDPDAYPDIAARIGRIIDWIADETQRGDPVSGNIILRLAEIITTEIGRVGRTHSVLFSERLPESDYDPRIWRAIAAISMEPEWPWTLAGMADVAGMSRSAFVARYSETVGQTPMRSLRRLRMHRAAIALSSQSRQAIAPLATATGYGSDAAFNRAFVKEFGQPPKQYGRRKPLRSRLAVDA